jgi:hypothetical protein
MDSRAESTAVIRGSFHSHQFKLKGLYATFSWYKAYFLVLYSRSGLLSLYRILLLVRSTGRGIDHRFVFASHQDASQLHNPGLLAA